MRFLAGSFLLMGIITTVLTGCKTAESHMIQGDSHFLRGDFELAIDEYHAATGKDPNLLGVEQKINKARFKLELKRGDLASQSKNWQQAERHYKEAGTIKPNDPSVSQRLQQLLDRRANLHFQEGQKLLGQGNPFHAIAEFEETLAILPTHQRARQAIEAAKNEKKNREETAEEEFQKGLEALERDEYQLAVRLFASANNKNPYHPNAKRELTNARRQLGAQIATQADALFTAQDWKQATQLYRKAIGLHPKLPGLAQKLKQAQQESRAKVLIVEGNKAYQAGDWKTAYQRFAHASELTQAQKEDLSLLTTVKDNLAQEVYIDAQNLEKAGQFEEALNGFREVAGFHPDFRDAKDRAEKLEVALRTARRAYQTACRAQQEHDLRIAREQFRICDELIPNFRDVTKRKKEVEDAFARAALLYNRGVKAQNRGDHDRARILFEECLSITNNYKDVKRRLDEARDTLVQSSDFEDRYKLACRLQEEGHLERSKKIFLECQKIQPEYRDITQRIRKIDATTEAASDLYDRARQAETTGKLARAEALFDECLSLVTPFKDAAQRRKRAQRVHKIFNEGLRLEREKHLFKALFKYEEVLHLYSSHPDAQRRAQRISELGKEIQSAYEKLLESQRQGKFKQALALAQQISQRVKVFRDVNKRIPLLESEVDYQQGHDLEEQGKYKEAAPFFERAENRTPGFRDSKVRHSACLNQASKPKSK